MSWNPFKRTRRRSAEGSTPREGRGVAVQDRPAGEALRQEVAAIWGEVLGQRDVGADADFFDLGGHSLMATQVVARIEKRLGVELSLKLVFEHPTVALLSREIERREQLAARGERRPEIRPIPRLTGTFPLSFAQERLWFLEQLEPGKATYNVAQSAHLRGPLSFDALARSFTEIMHRHESLRTTFVLEDDEPVQRVTAAPLRLPFPVIDLKSISKRGAREEEARRIEAAEASRSFDLILGPLIRVALLHLTADEHLLLFNLHHIISDGWSNGVIVREMGALYEALMVGRPSSLRVLEVQYVDFAVWQRQWLSSGVLDRQLGYWREQLAGAPVRLELATDRPRPAVPSGRGARLRLRVPRERSLPLEAYARRERATLFMVLIAGFQALLHRYTAQEDILVGSPIAGRNLFEIEALIGCFTNNLVYRLHPHGNLTFGALLAEAIEGTIGAYTHQELPFERLVEELQPERSLSLHPVFQVALVLHNAPLGAPTLYGLTLEPWEVPTATAKFDLLFDVTETPEGLSVFLEYACDLFDRSTIARFAEHLKNLFDAAVAIPDGPLGDLPLLAAQESWQLLHEGNDAPARSSPERCLHELFAEQVLRTPWRTAATCRDESLTYAELDKRSQRLAERLLSHGAEPGQRIALLAERSLAMLVAVLGILKAGATYLPLDPDLPPDRMRWILEDSRVPVLVTQAELLDRLPEHRAMVVCLEHDEVEGIPLGKPSAPVDGLPVATPAYVIYTSGSTGRPKGVVVSHSNVVRLFAATREEFNFDEMDVWSMFHSYAFDFSVWELWGALLFGGRLVIVPYAISRSPDAFHELLRRERVTVLNQTPSAFQALLQADAAFTGAGELAVHLIVFGGEALDPQSLRPWFERHGDRFPRLINMYGITETTVHVTRCRMTAEALGEGRGSLIGRAISDLTLLLLDRRLVPVPVGVPAEICVAGPGLSQGYLNHPELTAERFIPHSFGGEGERLYRSGDLARRLADGSLQYLGRIDHQVKVRGFRIELGEIQRALERHPAVQAALATLREESDGDRRLVAYWTRRTNQVLVAAGELRRFLLQTLPDYMVPAAFVEVSDWPLTANGKVNLGALPSPGRGSRQEDGSERAPRTPVEELLLGIWADVLGREGLNLGVHDDFFELGGHSLQATRLVSRIRETFAVELPLRTVFQSPTVAALATELEVAGFCGGKGRMHGLPSSIPALPRQVIGRSAFPLSFAQERLWFLDQLEPESSTYHITGAVDIVGRLKAPALAASIEEIVRRHEPLRTTFSGMERVDDEPVQRIALPSTAYLPELRQIDLAGLAARRRESQIRQLMAVEAGLPFDLQRGPLLRVTLIRLGEEQHRLLLTLHHIVSDGWSMGVFIRELTAVYAAFEAGLPPPLVRLPIQYADYAVWQRGRLSGEFLTTELDHWSAQLRDLTPLELPIDRPRPFRQGFRGARHTFVVPELLHRKLEAMSQREGVTLFMTLLAAFQFVLARYSGQDVFAVGTPVAGRNYLEIENLIGFFVNTLVLRADLTGDPTWRELLQRVRETALAGYAHQELPFEKLVAQLQPERSINQSPLFQVLFVLQNAPAGALELLGLEIAPIPVDPEGLKFDLTLAFELSGSGLLGLLDYDRDLFDATTVQRLGRHFMGVLTADFGVSLERCCSELALLTPEEWAQAQLEWNDTRREPLWEGAVHEQLARRAVQNPHATALLCGDEVLTYGELDRRVDSLASWLVAAGVRPEVRVGLCMQPSFEMLIGLFGILKAGGAYVPLDPQYPVERLALMIGDSKVPLLLTQERFRQRLSGGAARLVFLDTLHGEVSSAPTPPPALPGSAAYVIYTSGSSGVPKGVVAVQSGLSNFTRAMAEILALGPGDRVLQFASLSFDASAVQIFPALTRGSTLVLHPNPRALSPGELADLCIRTGVTVLDLPAALWRQWVADVAGAGMPVPPAVRCYLTGGESVPATALRDWSSWVGPGARFLSSYGPTEATITTTAFQTTAVEAALLTLGELPIGRTFANARVYLLDERLLPVPQGVSGEVWIGGAGVTRGYLNLPGMTAERFRPDPWPPEPGGRLYRTGDRARRLGDGVLQFLGRRDHQVKIRGFRVELEEIESALRAYPGVKERAVVLREITRSESRLVAYLVADRELELTSLDSALRQSLPEYMVPVLVRLPEIPLTPTGKIDRRFLAQHGALPELARGAGYLAPRTALESQLATIFAEVLSVDGVGVEDNFFELGGHSLLATQVMSRLRRALGEDLPLRVLFERPTVRGLAAEIERSLRGTNEAELPPLMRVPRAGAQPLSFAQERLWFIDQLEPGSAQYNVASALDLTGPLQPAALAWALGQLELRHETLRTTFAVLSDTPVQVIGPARTSFPLPLVDFVGLGEKAKEERAAYLAGAEAARPFRLERDPVWRATLLRLSGERHVLLLTIHHIAADGWSAGVLVREVAELYGAVISGRRAQLSELPIQYADYAVWQREWLQGKVLERQLGYWKHQLAGAPDLLNLPTDRPRPAVQTFVGSSLFFRLPEDLARGLEALSRDSGATLFMTLLAAFQVLLGRYSGQEDVVVGTPIAGRTHVLTEGLIGFFVNSLAIRTRFFGDPEFLELLVRVRESALSAFAHQDLPFEKLVSELQFGRDRSHSPLFQVLFAQNVPFASLGIPGLQIVPMEIDSGTAKFDLTVTVMPANGGMIGALEYNRDLFDRTTARRLASCFVRLLESAVAAPKASIGQLSLLSSYERHQLLREWNATPGEPGWRVPLPQLLAARASANFETPAVIGGGAVLTYGQLYARAARVATRLRELGVNPGTRVGLCLERSPDLIVGLLATLGAGGVYVILEPSYPEGRLSFLLADSGVAVLVTRSDLATWLPAGGPAVLFLDRDEDLPGDECAFPVSAGIEELLYIIYTSGSTGEPKGAGVYQSGFVNLLRWYVDEFGLSAEDRFLVMTAPGFDLTQKNFFAPLLCGGLLVLADPGLYDPREIVATISRYQITRLNCTPSAFYPLIEEAGVEGLSSLRSVFLGGEPIARSRLAPWRRSGGIHAAVINTYGPTECTDVVAFHRLPCSEDAGPVPVPLGRPLPGFRLLVLDAHLSPVPIGAPGQLAIGGVGVGAGYLGRADLTAEKFIPDRFAEVPGMRLYWTGDLARVLPGGEIEFLGRADHQVKLRGLRIELGEIETVLGQHEGVREVVVLAREDRSDETRLVGYVTPAGEPAPTPEELQSFLLKRLPGYMVPGEWVLLKEFPLSVNGKVDRKALPNPEETAGRKRGWVAPRGWVEEILAGIWMEVLQREQVGVEDDFFALGGHSLLATQVVSRVRRALGVELPLRALFEAPRLAALALRVEQVRVEQVPETLPITPVPRLAELPLSFAQQRLWFVDQLDPGNPAYNIPLFVRLVGPLAVPALWAALAEILCRHEALRGRFPVVRGVPVQEIVAEIPCGWLLVDHGALPRAAAATELARVKLDEQGHRFDLERGPLLRAVLVRGNAEEHAVLLSLHHIAIDGWSLAVFARELGTLYTAAVEHRPASLPELPVQYCDYAAWQRRLLHGPALDRLLAYWTRKLATLPPPWPFPMTARARNGLASVAPLCP